MSRLFNGTTDLMTYALPAAGTGPVNYGFGTVLVVLRYVTSTTWASMVEIEDSGAILKGGLSRDSGGNMGWSDGAIFRRTSDAGTGSAAYTIGTGDNWCLYAMTKPTGAASITLHKVPIATGVRESRTITATSANTAGIASGRIHIGGNDDFANVRYAVASVLSGVVLTGADIDGIVTAKTTASILALAPADGWVVDDSDGFLNNLVANNTNRSAISGTASDADNPAGWVYGLAAAPSYTPRREYVVPNTAVIQSGGWW